MRIDRIKSKPAGSQDAPAEPAAPVKSDAEETETKDKEPSRKRRPRRRRKKEPVAANEKTADDKSGDQTPPASDQEPQADEQDAGAAEKGAEKVDTETNEERPPRRRRRGRRGGRRRNQRSAETKENGAQEDAASDGNGAVSMPSEEVIDDATEPATVSAPDSAQTVELTDQTPPADASAHDADDGTPRRGWWQRMVE